MSAMDSSVLDTIGADMISVICPVSITMFLVVFIVYTLSPSSPLSDSQPIRTAANMAYMENPSDSATQKLEGALLNALIFIVFIALMTFILVLLYYYRFTGFLKNYMRFSAFFVLGMMGGSVFLSIIQHFSIPIDSITCSILLFNFTVVGALSMFSGAIPIVLRQAYMVALGVFLAVWFIKLPEWTTWVLLLALALYDLVAVLAPGGPLKLLVELAQSRDEELPALVYESRPTAQQDSPTDTRRSVGFFLDGFSESGLAEMQCFPAPPDPAQTGQSRSRNDGQDNGPDNQDTGEEVSLLVDADSQTGARALERAESGPMDRGVKLGLGDFVFYSVLVGRAALYDLMTVYACYLAVISGLCSTLLLLSLYRRALPALPISIALGVIFYFLTRIFLEPFVVQVMTDLLMF